MPTALQHDGFNPDWPFVPVVGIVHLLDIITASAAFLRADCETLTVRISEVVNSMPWLSFGALSLLPHSDRCVGERRRLRTTSPIRSIPLFPLRPRPPYEYRYPAFAKNLRFQVLALICPDRVSRIECWFSF